jgi:tape measure domain-containing protein
VVYRIEIPITAQDKTDPALGQAQNKLSRFEKSMQRTEKQMQRMNRTKMQLILSAVDRASAVISHITQKAGSLAGKTFHITFKALDYVTRPLRAIGRLATSTIGLLTAGAGAWGGIIKPLGLSGDMEQAQIAFTTMLRSAEKANTLLGSLEQMANRTPFEFPEIRDNAKYMLAFGFGVEKIIPMMRTIGDTSSGLSLGADGVDRIVRALGQMKAKGRPMAQELLQLYETGVPAAQILQEELGLTAEQVANIGEQALSADKVITALLKGMEKRYGGMMEAQSKTLLGLKSTIADTFKNSLLRRWGDGLREGVIKPMQELVSWIDANPEKIAEWGEAWEQAGKQVADWALAKIERLKRAMGDLVNSREWIETKGLGDKLKLAWAKVIEEPFAEWWAGGGQDFVKNAAQNIGTALGGLLGGFIMSALGIAADSQGEQSIFVEAGTTAGSAFLEAFLQAFDADKVAAKAAEAFKNMQGEVGKFAPGGEKPGAGSFLGLALDAWLLGGAFKLLGKGGGLFKLFGKGARAGATGAATAAATSTATAAGTAAASTVPIYGPGGQILKTVATNADDAARAVAATKGVTTGMKGLGAASRIAGRVAVPLAAGMDIYSIATAEDKSREASRVAGGWAGAFGGAKLGAMGGAAIGSVVPIVGTAAGAIIGSLLGGIGGYFAGGALGQGLHDAIANPTKQNIEEAKYYKYNANMHKSPRYAAYAMAEDGAGAWRTPQTKYAPVPVGVPQAGGNKTLTIKVETKPTFAVETAASADEVVKIIRQRHKEIADVIGKELADQLENYFDNTPAPAPRRGQLED